MWNALTAASHRRARLLTCPLRPLQLRFERPDQRLLGAARNPRLLDPPDDRVEVFAQAIAVAQIAALLSPAVPLDRHQGVAMAFHA